MLNRSARTEADAASRLEQGKYYTEPYGKADQETNQAKDQAVADNFWKLCSDLTEELLGERLN